MPQNRPELRGQIDESVPHFTWEEVRCNHCRMLPDNLGSVINAGRMMEKVRDLLGGEMVRVNSWYRCPEYNARIGGASDSQHLYGRAIDFTVKHLSPRQVQARLARHRDVVRGLGRYLGFTHCDNRPGPNATWNG
jgi:uncharacterized protein YcbK (DUF882 family)